jgi:hypothetical protein
LAPGASLLVNAVVSVASTATVGSSVTRLLTATSAHDHSKKDAVKFVASRT